MRLIDAEKLEKALVGRLPYQYVTDTVIKKMPTVDAIPIEWLKENLIGTEFHFGKGVDNTLAGEIVWQMIVDWWHEDNGDEWWRDEEAEHDEV